MDDGGLTADLTIVEVLSRWRQTEAVLRRYNEQAGVCLCCQALFDTLGEAAQKYGLNLAQLLQDLQAVIE